MKTNVVETPKQFAHFNLARLRACLRMEIAGMKGRGASALSQLRAMGYKGGRAKVLAAVHRDLESLKKEKESVDS